MSNFNEIVWPKPQKGGWMKSSMRQCKTQVINTVTVLQKNLPTSSKQVCSDSEIIAPHVFFFEVHGGRHAAVISNNSSASSRCSNTTGSSHNALIWVNYEKLAGWEMRCHLRVSAGQEFLMCFLWFMISSPCFLFLFFSQISLAHWWVCRMGLVCSTELNYKFGLLIYLITGLSFHPFLIIPRILAAGNEM